MPSAGLASIIQGKYENVSKDENRDELMKIVAPCPQMFATE
jgi:hypothetical protein